jgi:hypothetical protein
MTTFPHHLAVQYMFLPVFRKLKRVAVAVHLVVMDIQVQVLHCLPLLLVQ